MNESDGETTTGTTETYEAVLFDLDRTLIELKQDEQALFEDACSAVDIEPFCEPELLETAAALVTQEAKDLSPSKFTRRVFRTAASAAGVDVDAGRLADAYKTVLDNNAVSLRPGAAEALAIAEAYSSAIVTNGPEETHRTRLESVGLEAHVDAVVFGSDVPQVKPARNPFETAIQRLGVDPTRTLKVGDSLTTDVAGANAVGIDSAWIPYDDQHRVDDDPEPTYELATLTDLTNIL